MQSVARSLALQQMNMRVCLQGIMQMRNYLLIIFNYQLFLVNMCGWLCLQGIMGMRVRATAPRRDLFRSKRDLL